MERENNTRVERTEETEQDSKVVRTHGMNKQLLLFKGILFSVLAGFFFSITTLITKHMKDTHPGQAALYRCIGIFVFTLPSFVKVNENHIGPPNYRWIIIARAVVGGSNIFLQFMAFRNLPLGEAATLVMSYPMFVILMARIFLKEPCRVSQVIITCVSIIGTSFVAGLPEQIINDISPYQNKDRLYGVIYAVASIIFTSAHAILLRKLKDVHEVITLFHYSWIAALTSVALVFAFGGTLTFTHHCGDFRGYLILVLGFCSYVSVLFLTMAFQCEIACLVTTSRAATDILMSFIFQTTIFHEETKPFGIAGACLVSFCIMVIGIQKWLLQLPDDSKTRKRFSWLIY